MVGARSLGFCTSLHVEHWAALLGLQLAWEQGFLKLKLETDSMLVYKMLTKLDPTQLVHDALDNKCISLLSRSWEVEITKIYGEANYVADDVANWALTPELGFYVLTTPPVSLRNSLDIDTANICFPRAVPFSSVLL